LISRTSAPGRIVRSSGVSLNRTFSRSPSGRTRSGKVRASFIAAPSASSGRTLVWPQRTGVTTSLITTRNCRFDIGRSSRARAVSNA
jgi:hypothetical protein